MQNASLYYTVTSILLGQSGQDEYDIDGVPGWIVESTLYEPLRS